MNVQILCLSPIKKCIQFYKIFFRILAENNNTQLKIRDQLRETQNAFKNFNEEWRIQKKQLKDMDKLVEALQNNLTSENSKKFDAFQQTYEKKTKGKKPKN